MKLNTDCTDDTDAHGSVKIRQIREIRVPVLLHCLLLSFEAIVSIIFESLYYHAGKIISITDQYETSPSEGWPRWCNNQIEEADFVLVVCTGIYELENNSGWLLIFDNAEAILKIAEELDYLSLALEQAGAYIKELKSGFSNYLSSYRTRGLDMFKKTPPVTGKYPKSVATTWLLNLSSRERQNLEKQYQPPLKV